MPPCRRCGPRRSSARFSRSPTWPPSPAGPRWGRLGRAPPRARPPPRPLAAPGRGSPPTPSATPPPLTCPAPAPPARAHAPPATAGALTCLGHPLGAGGRAGEALRGPGGAAGSAAPASAELVAARAIESFPRLILGDLDGAWSAGAEAQSAGLSAGDGQNVGAAMTPLVLAAQQHTSLAVGPHGPGGPPRRGRRSGPQSPPAARRPGDPRPRRD